MILSGKRRANFGRVIDLFIDCMGKTEGLWWLRITYPHLYVRKTSEYLVRFFQKSEGRSIQGLRDNVKPCVPPVVSSRIEGFSQLVSGAFQSTMKQPAGRTVSRCSGNVIMSFSIAGEVCWNASIPVPN